MDSVLSPLLLELQAFSELPPGLPSPGLLPATPASRGRGTFAAPPALLSLAGRKERGKPGLLLAGYCSQMETVKPCQPQTHSENAISAFLECVTAQLHLLWPSIQ